MLHFECPKCGKKLGADESKAGKVCVCPECQSKFRIPAAPTVDEVTTSPRRKPARSAEEEDPPPPVRKGKRVADDEDVSSNDDEAERQPEDDEPSPRVRKRRPIEDEEDLSAEEDEAERRPAGKRKKKRRKSSSGLPLGLDLFTASLIGVGVFGLLSVVPVLIWPSASYLPIGLGWLLAMIGGFWFLVVAFQEDATAGLLCLFVPFYSLYFLITHFNEAKRPFFVQMVGTILLMVGSCAGAISGFRANAPKMPRADRPVTYALAEPDASPKKPRQQTEVA